MNQKLSHMSLISISIVLGLLIVCNAQLENRGLSSAAPRKPPFNGSIFGKRSLWPEMHGAAQTGREYYRNSSPIGELGLLIKQHEALIKASINECLALQRASDLDLDQPIGALCAKLLETQPGGTLRNFDGEKWFGQFISSGRSID